MKLYNVNLTEEERKELTSLTTTGRQSVRRTLHARILLKADNGLIDEEISEHLNISVRTAERVRKRCVLEGIEAALNPKHRPPRTRPRRSTKLFRQLRLVESLRDSKFTIPQARKLA